MYLVTAYRWGLLNNHQYYVYAGPDKTKALALAQAEPCGRGGKYGCAVYCFADDGISNTLEAYFPSSYAEEKPYHDERLDMFVQLGVVLRNYAQGIVYLPDPDRDGILKPVKMDPPEWVVSEVKRAEELAEAKTKARKVHTTERA